MSGHGSLIVIEGPDGVGKTTLTHALVTRLRHLGFPCHTYAFPGNEPGTLGSLVLKQAWFHRGICDRRPDS